LNLTLKKKNAIRTWLFLLAATGLNACVTINIYFPAAAAEKAADKVIDEIWQVPTSTSPVSPSATPVTPAVNPEPAP